MINYLLRHLRGYTKHPCFLCYWDNRASDQHWIKKDWPQEDLAVGNKNIINEPLVNWDYIILRPLHIKLGLMKQFVKALDKDGDCFNYIAKLFLGLSMEKLKAGIFDGSQILKLMQDQTLHQFENLGSIFTAKIMQNQSINHAKRSIFTAKIMQNQSSLLV